MRVSLRKNGLTSLFKEVRGFQGKKARIPHPYRTPSLPEKEGETLKKKEILARRENKEFSHKKNKKRKNRALLHMKKTPAKQL